MGTALGIARDVAGGPARKTASLDMALANDAQEQHGSRGNGDRKIITARGAAARQSL